MCESFLFLYNMRILFMGVVTYIYYKEVRVFIRVWLVLKKCIMSTSVLPSIPVQTRARDSDNNVVALYNNKCQFNKYVFKCKTEGHI